MLVNKKQKPVLVCVFGSFQLGSLRKSFFLQKERMAGAVFGPGALPSVPLVGGNLPTAITQTSNFQGGINALAAGLNAVMPAVTQNVSQSYNLGMDPSAEIGAQIRGFPGSMDTAQRKPMDILRTYRAIEYEQGKGQGATHIQQEDPMFARIPETVGKTTAGSLFGDLALTFGNARVPDLIVYDRMPNHLYNLAQVNAIFAAEQVEQLLRAAHDKDVDDRYWAIRGAPKTSDPLERYTRSLWVLGSAKKQWQLSRFLWDGAADNVINAPEHMVADSKQGGFQFLRNIYNPAMNAGDTLWWAVVPVRYRPWSAPQSRFSNLASHNVPNQDAGLEDWLRITKMIEGSSYARQRAEELKLDSKEIGTRAFDIPEKRESGRRATTPIPQLLPQQKLELDEKDIRLLENTYASSVYIYQLIPFSERGGSGSLSIRALQWLSNGVANDNLFRLRGYDVHLMPIARMKAALKDTKFFQHIMGYDADYLDAASQNPDDPYWGVHQGYGLLDRVELANDYQRQRKASNRQFETFMCVGQEFSFCPVDCSNTKLKVEYRYLKKVAEMVEKSQAQREGKDERVAGPDAMEL